MATIGDLVVGLGLDRRGFSRGIGGAQRDLSRFVGTVLTAGAAGLGAFAVKLAADAEQTKTALKSMLGSAELAEQVFTKLEKFSASTPFQSAEINEAAQKLIAFNTSADEVISTLRAVGDVAAAIGAPLGQIAEIYGKAKVQGRLFGEDINQLTGRGIPIISELAKQFGVAESEVKALVASGRVNFSHLEAAFKSLTSEGGKFSGMMAAQSKTIKGAWSTLLDNLKLILKDIGEMIIDAFDLKDSIKGTTTMAQVWRKQVAPVIKIVLKLFAGLVRFAWDFLNAMRGSITVIVAFVAALVSIVVALKAVAVAQAIALALSGPKGWAILAIGATAAAAAVAATNSQFDRLKNAAKSAAANVSGVNDKLAETKKVAEAATAATKRQSFEFIKQRDALRTLNPAIQLNDRLQRIRRSRGVHLVTDPTTGKSRIRHGLQTNTADALERHQIDQATGVFSRIKETTDAIRVLRGETTEAEIALRDMLKNGAPPEEVNRLRGLMKDLKQQKAAKARAEEIARNRKQQAAAVKADLQTPVDKLKKKLDQLADLVLSAELTGDEYNAAVDKAVAGFRDQVGQDNKNDDPRFADRLDARSAEGFAAVIKAATPRADKQDKANAILTEIAKSNVAIKDALDRANGIAEDEPEQEPVAVGAFN